MIQTALQVLDISPALHKKPTQFNYNSFIDRVDQMTYEDIPVEQYDQCEPELDDHLKCDALTRKEI